MVDGKKIYVSWVLLVHHNIAALWDSRRKDAEALLKVPICSSVSLKTINTKLNTCCALCFIAENTKAMVGFHNKDLTYEIQ